MRKRMISFLLTFCVLLTVVGCGPKEPSYEEKQALAEAKLKAEREEQEKIRLQQEEEKEKAKKEEEQRKAEEAKRLEEEKRKAPKSPLSGLPMKEDLSNRRSVGIMISNISYALPQSGIESADIIYETLAEGGVTRLFAVFHEFQNEKIGPIRSCRHYFLDFALDHDAVYFHAGQSPQGQLAIQNLKISAVNSISYLSLIAFYLDPNRKAPHSTYTGYERVMEGWKRKEYRTEPNKETGRKLNFSQDKEILLENGKTVYHLKLPYSYIDTPYFTYDREKGEYLRFQFGKPHIDVETGNQLHFTNIILQVTDIWHIPGDDAGRLDMKLIGEGKGYFFTRGKMIPITWKKESHVKTTHYYDESGKEILLNPGKTWIGVYPVKRENLIEMYDVVNPPKKSEAEKKEQKK